MYNLKSGDIVTNLNPNEPVIILSTDDFGDEINIEYKGTDTNHVNSVIIPKSKLSSLAKISQQGSFDFSGNAEKFAIFSEAYRIKSAYQFDPLFAVNCSIVDPLPHQIEAVYRYLLPLPRIRFLLADDTGAGKTIMTGLLIRELMLRELIERVLIITPGGLTKQWQEDELAIKFNMNFKLLNRAVFDSDPNIFNSSNLVVTSIDFIRNEDVLNVARDSTWDLIVVDEAHKLSAYEYGQKQYISKRYQALETLSNQTEHLLLLTATPHRGRKDTFKYLLKLLDPDIFTTDEKVSQRIVGSDEKTHRFFLRRLKEDMKDWDGKPLFKPRHTKTVKYQLTKEEKNLYDRVTRYLTSRRAEAVEQKNVHVTLALMVMQRRLTSSIYAIMKTLQNRYNALRGVLDLVRENPSLWKARMKYDFEFNDLDDFDELTDEERESLENILSDPRKFKLFTTAKTRDELESECVEVEELVEIAQSLYRQNQEEQKLRELYTFLQEQKVIDGKKLVIFTEHKDTLDYLEKKLKNKMYRVETIYGQKSVEQRRQAQDNFANEGNILIATDAAGEGINLQFCNLLINWDIPWNPNRLEQRMGRVHRYGQKEDVYVFNLVAQNTREGKVMQKLLDKLEVIREQIGNDRVYDVISDVFESVRLDDIIRSAMEGELTTYNQSIDRDLTEENVVNKIREQKESLRKIAIDFRRARELKDSSDEQRLQPIYVHRFFEKAYRMVGGEVHSTDDFLVLKHFPDELKQLIRKRYNLSFPDIERLFFTFDKRFFLEHKSTGKYEKLYFLSPGNPVFDAMLTLVRQKFKEEVLRGCILVSAEENYEYPAFLVRSQISDQRNPALESNIVDEKILLIMKNADGEWIRTSPAKIIDLIPPRELDLKPETPAPASENEVIRWVYQNITNPQYEMIRENIATDIRQRKRYIEEGFDDLIMLYQMELSELYKRRMAGDPKTEEKIVGFESRIDELKGKKQKRMGEMALREELNKKKPEIIGALYVIPLSGLENRAGYGMSRDEDVEKIAMQIAMDYEKSEKRKCEDVSGQNMGYDLKSTDEQHFKRYIEVKGRAETGDVMLSENEFFRLRQLSASAWLYVVTHCKSNPVLHRIQDPGNRLHSEKRSKGYQYLVHQREWENKSI